MHLLFSIQVPRPSPIITHLPFLASFCSFKQCTIQTSSTNRLSDMSDHSNNTDEYPASSEGRRPTSSNRANSYSQHRSEDEDQDNAHTPPSPSAFIWGGSRRTISSPTSYPPGPNSDRRGDISSTSAPNRRTGGNSSSATGAYSSSSTLDYNPQMSQHNARQNAPSPLAQDTRMDHPASSSTGPSPLPAENGRASRPYPPEGRQSKRQRRELDDNVGSAELNTVSPHSMLVTTYLTTMPGDKQEFPRPPAKSKSHNSQCR